MLKPIGFWSYCSTDDEYSRGRLSQLRAMLAAELQQRIGRSLKVNIFQDVAAIPPGMEWEKQIREALGGSFFLIPIVTPALLQSEWCCQEIRLFREREATALLRNDLVFPLHYISIDNLDVSQREDCQDPEVFGFLRTRQWIDFRTLRLKDPESEDVAVKVAGMADAICAALRRSGQKLEEQKSFQDAVPPRLSRLDTEQREREAEPAAETKWKLSGIVRSVAATFIIIVVLLMVFIVTLEILDYLPLWLILRRLH